jgi:hypothetical protein
MDFNVSSVLKMVEEERQHEKKRKIIYSPIHNFDKANFILGVNCTFILFMGKGFGGH